MFENVLKHPPEGPKHRDFYMAILHIFSNTFFNENVLIFLQVSLKFHSKDPVDYGKP